MCMCVCMCVLCVLKVVYSSIICYWVCPRRIQKIMEKQGVRGPKPRFLVGNILDMASLLSQSTATDCLSLHHDIVSRLLPHYILWSKTYGTLRYVTLCYVMLCTILFIHSFFFYPGKRFIFWNGVEPRLCLTETHLIKELLSKYSTLSGKSWLQQQGSKHFIGRGLLMANGDDWSHQRHIVAPAFMGDKLKVHFTHLYTKCTTIQYDQILTTVIQ